MIILLTKKELVAWRRRYYYVNMEHENRRIDACEILFLSYDFPKWHQIREIFGYGERYSDN